MPWYLHVLLALIPLVIVAVVFMALHLLTRLNGIRGYAPGWQLRCSRCGETRDASEAGMVRIGGLMSCKLGYCSHCGGFRWIIVERKRADA